MGVYDIWGYLGFLGCMGCWVNGVIMAFGIYGLEIYVNIYIKILILIH